MITEEMKAERMAEDARRIRAWDKWPLKTYLPLKTQPWVKPWRSATLALSDFTLPDGDLRVIARDGVNSWIYNTVEEAVKTWSVD